MEVEKLCRQHLTFCQRWNHSRCEPRALRIKKVGCEKSALPQGSHVRMLKDLYRWPLFRSNCIAKRRIETSFAWSPYWLWYDAILQSGANKVAGKGDHCRGDAAYIHRQIGCVGVPDLQQRIRFHVEKASLSQLVNRSWNWMLISILLGFSECDWLITRQFQSGTA